MCRPSSTNAADAVTGPDYARWRAPRLGAAVDRASPLAGKWALDVGASVGTYAISATARSAHAPFNQLLTRLYAPGGAFLTLAADRPLEGQRR